MEDSITLVPSAKSQQDILNWILDYCRKFASWQKVYDTDFAQNDGSTDEHHLNDF